jgi:hypothetical protein
MNLHTANRWKRHQPFHGRPYMRRRKAGGWDRSPIAPDSPEYSECGDWLESTASPEPIGWPGRLGLTVAVLIAAAICLWFIAVNVPFD